MKKVLWIGPIVHPSEVSKFKAISPAANNWQIGLINGLRSVGCKIEVVSYSPYPLFPMGKLFGPGNQETIDGMLISQLPYLNIPYFRSFFLSGSHIKKIKSIGDVDLVITYNTSHHNVSVGKYFQRNCIPWISVVADRNYAGNANLTVFLSYGYFTRAQIKEKMHLDGGVDNFIELDVLRSPGKVLLFSGALTMWTGIIEFAQTFSELDESGKNGFELHIYGKGHSEILNVLALKHNNIVVKGFVPGEELHEARKKAFAFINPRPTDVPGGENNFPSKLLEYLRYGKPIISSKTDGLAPYFDDLLFYFDPKDKGSIGKIINKLINLDQKSQLNIQNKMRQFCNEHTWKKQASGLIEKIRELQLYMPGTWGNN